MNTPVFDKTVSDFKEAEASFMLRGKIETYGLMLEQLRAITKPSKQIVDFIGKLERELKKLGAKNG